MDTTRYCVRQLDENAATVIRGLFVDVFTREPWYDDWSDENQLKLYIHDLIGHSNSLTFGLYEENQLIGISMGRIKHWYTGTEYCIDELCISTSRQRNGMGTLFVSEIEKACKELGLTHIFLQTENNVPAYEFYNKLGFYELKNNVSFAKAIM